MPSPDWLQFIICNNRPDHARSVVLIAVKILVFWVVMPCSDVAGYQRFTGLCWLQLQFARPEDGGNIVIRNVGTLQQHYTVSHPRRPRLKSSANLRRTRSKEKCVDMSLRR